MKTVIVFIFPFSFIGISYAVSFVKNVQQWRVIFFLIEHQTPVVTSGIPLDVSLSQVELCPFFSPVFFHLFVLFLLLYFFPCTGRRIKMKLGKVELCHFLQIVALFLCLSGMSQAELPRSGSKPYFQAGKSRTKRSWVWNQFFVLEEYMGSDPLYVGKVGEFISQYTNSCLM